jgi:hypothetical protein
MADPISVTGKWVLPDGRVADKEPVEGRLLVSPGGPITPDVKQAIEAAEAAAPPAGDEPEQTESGDDAKEQEPDSEQSSASTRKRAATR